MRAQYGYEEVETRYVMWLGECATPDNSWGPPQARNKYMAEWALVETMVAALDVNGWRKLLKLGFRDHSDADILRVLHEKRASSRYQSARARADCSRWLQDHPENAGAKALTLARQHRRVPVAVAHIRRMERIEPTCGPTVQR